jgi:hypothetical protein
MAVDIGEPTSLRGLALRSEYAGEQERFLFLPRDPGVRFRACPEVDVAYPGGFIAKHPICVMLHVQQGVFPIWVDSSGCERLLSQLNGKSAQPLGRGGSPRLHGELTVKDSRRVRPPWRMPRSTHTER